MENNWRDDPITEGQIRMVKFINLMLGKNFHPTTKGEADDIIKAYQTAAQAEKDRRDSEKAEKQKRIDQTQPIVDRLQGKKRTSHIHPLKRGQRPVVMDYEALKDLVAKKNTTMKALNEMLGQNHSYLSQRYSQHDGKIPQSFVEQICNFLGCAPADFIPEVRLPLPDETKKAPDMIEQAEKAQITSTYETSTIDDAEGKPIVEVQKPVTQTSGTTPQLFDPVLDVNELKPIPEVPEHGVMIAVDDRLRAFAMVMDEDVWSFIMTAIDNRINEIRGRLS